ncbi:ATP-binding protein [Anditalea andensis]|uniref:ATP-binding protein n=1 Tax=Anditalea andensis TaxID=1048983 RepID=UPI0013E0ABE8|nr:ATP-binding protein [Anditalea andensis]
MRLLTEFAWYIHHSDSSQKFYLEAINLSRKLNDHKYLPQNLNRYGVTFRNLDLQENALELYEEALNISIATGNKIEEGYAYNNLAQIINYQGLQEEALSYYTKAEAIFTHINYPVGLGYTYNGFSTVFREMGQYDKAIDAINKSMAVSNGNKDTREYLTAILKRGDLYGELKMYEEALADYQLYLTKVKDLYPRGELNIYGRMALLYYNEGEVDKALQYADKALALHEKHPSLEVILPIYQGLSKYYASIGNYKSAYQYNLEYSQSKELLFEERINQYLTNHKIRSQDAEIKALELDRQLQADKNILKKYVNSGLILLLILATTLTMTYYRSYKNEKNNLALLDAQKKEIQKQAEELDKLNSVKDKLFSILAHDLRGPLNALRGMIELLEEDTLSPEEFRDVIPLVSQNVGNNSILLENLLIWSRSQMQGMQTLPEIVKIKQVLSDNFEFIDPLSRKKDIIIDNHIREDVLVKADKGMVDIVMRNLLTNSIKFTPAGGNIIVDAEDEGDSWKIIISDSGVGIAAENLSKIFSNKFFTTTGTHKEKGSGLGLILSKELIEKNNGKIWLHSIEGEGTTFYFTFPKA